MYLAFIPGSWHRASKTFEISLVVELEESSSLFIVNCFQSYRDLRSWVDKVPLGGPLDSFQMEAGCQRSQSCEQRVRTFNSTHLTSKEGR